MEGKAVKDWLRMPGGFGRNRWGCHFSILRASLRLGAPSTNLPPLWPLRFEENIFSRPKKLEIPPRKRGKQLGELPRGTSKGRPGRAGARISSFSQNVDFVSSAGGFSAHPSPVEPYLASWVCVLRIDCRTIVAFSAEFGWTKFDFFF